MRMYDEVNDAQASLLVARIEAATRIVEFCEDKTMLGDLAEAARAALAFLADQFKVEQPPAPDRYANMVVDLRSGVKEVLLNLNRFTKDDPRPAMAEVKQLLQSLIDESEK